MIKQANNISIDDEERSSNSLDVPEYKKNTDEYDILQLVENEVSQILSRVTEKHKNSEAELAAVIQKTKDENSQMSQQLRDFEIENKKLLLQNMNLLQLQDEVNYYKGLVLNLRDQLMQKSREQMKKLTSQNLHNESEDSGSSFERQNTKGKNAGEGLHSLKYDESVDFEDQKESLNSSDDQTKRRQFDPRSKNSSTVKKQNLVD